MNCALSARRLTSHPDDDGDAAREGTCAAWVAELIINGDASCGDDLVGKSHENGWPVDVEMARHIDVYVATVTRPNVSSDAEVYRQHDIGLQGTLDHEGMAADGSLLYITDLKYGYDIVEPFQNWQLLCYLWLHVATTGNFPPMVQLAIYQPRAIHTDGVYRKWVVSRAEYEPYLARISARLLELNAGEDVAVPHTYCKYCANAAGCVALTRTVYEMMTDVHTSRQFREPTPAQLSQELATLRFMSTMFEARKAAIESEVVTQLSIGGFVPNWALERSYGKRKFTVSATAIRMITGVDPTENKLCTPAELIRRGANEMTLKTITTTPFIGTKLVKRDADDVASAFRKTQNK